MNSRLRRLRARAALRDLVAESRLEVGRLVHPLFVRHGSDVEHPIGALPGHAQRSVDRLGEDLDDMIALGVSTFLLFGIPEAKDERGSRASDERGPVPRAAAMIRERHPDAIVIADVCLCEYTSHGHCGVLGARDAVDNDTTLPLLADAAVAYANAGADVVAPSAMMDGQVGAIRAALDAAGHTHVAILSYAVKYASAFYGPFREAAESTPAHGDRRGYQMDSRNAREALREAELDVKEGADMLMVKPAGPYLDVLRQVRDRFALPMAAYQVSGEYAMIKAAAQRGWLDERRAALETLTGIRRAGADIVITYYAKQAAQWLNEDDAS